MTQEEIIRMAREAEASFETAESMFKFAALVAAAEREACAKIVEESGLPDSYSEACLPYIANEIRARGQA